MCGPSEEGDWEESCALFLSFSESASPVSFLCTYTHKQLCRIRVNFAMANAYFHGAFSFRSVGQQYGFAISKLTELILA